MKESIQTAFLTRLEEIIPTHSTLVGELADLLEISNDSAYRRIRGETKLSIDEVLILCRHFNLSFDTFINQQQAAIQFLYRPLEKTSEAFYQHLIDLQKNLELIKASKSRHIIYACEDIPLFHNLSSEGISAFKIFYWLKSILNLPEYADKKFEMDSIDSRLIQEGYKLFRLYSEIPSTEIWTDTTVESTVKQIHYYWSSGIFKSDEDALFVCRALKDTMLGIQKMAETKTKVAGNFEFEANYELFFSDLEITNNSVLVKMGDISTVFLGHLTFQTMATANRRYCDETEFWLNNLKSKSTLISGVGEKSRNRFFKKSIAFIDDLIQTIEKGED